MKKKRTIRIRNPQLRKVRNQLRLLLIKAESVESMRLLEEMDALDRHKDGTIKSIDDLSPEELKRFRTLQKSESENRRIVRASICQCATCRQADKDMTFNPAYNMWFCVDCYAKTGEFYKQVLQERTEKGVSREDYDDFDEDYFKSFT